MRAGPVGVDAVPMCGDAVPTRMNADQRHTLFLRWLAPDGAGLDAIDALRVEHHVMTAVLAAMEAEAERMLGGASLRPDFWRNVIDCNGNFVHRCHRTKEESLLVPALVANGILAERQVQAVHREHVAGGELTQSLCEGIGEADWEKVLRLVAIYAHLMRPHMQREEEGLFALAATLPMPVRERLRADCVAVEQQVLGADGRARFAAMARGLAEQAGVAHALTLTPGA